MAAPGLLPWLGAHHDDVVRIAATASWKFPLLLHTLTATLREALRRA